MIQLPTTELREKLDYHYKAFDKSKISPDPLQFLHLFSDQNDIEIMGFIASAFAYGNVNRILTVLNNFLQISDYQPYNYITNSEVKKDFHRLILLKHRFYSANDIIIFFQLIKLVYKNFGSLRNLFLQGYEESDADIKNGLNRFNKYLSDLAARISDAKNLSPGLKFMFPLPENGSACKRSNLFLRWMVRKDELDFGIWKEIPPSKLIIPVDTHIAGICKKLNLTGSKTVSWKMAKEITLNLKLFDPKDPVKYDFALCHIGMRKMKF